MNALVGYTGFVGSNIHAAGKFDAVYNSKNIESAYDTKPDLLVYAGVRAEKYLANNAPQKDMEQIIQAEKNISRIKPNRIVLISTIDVLSHPQCADEDSQIDSQRLSVYGYDRYQLELWVRQHYPDALIVRLPGLFGKNLKKNFIYDYINIIPQMLSKAKFEEIVAKDVKLEKYYVLQENGYYKAQVSLDDWEKVKNRLLNIGFTALNFTDSRSRYQFYNLSRLWNDIQIALENGLKVLHLATEPLSAGELYEYLTGNKFVNEILETPADYDFRTKYYALFGGNNGFIEDKVDVMEQISDFVLENAK